MLRSFCAMAAKTRHRPEEETSVTSKANQEYRNMLEQRLISLQNERLNVEALLHEDVTGDADQTEGFEYLERRLAQIDEEIEAIEDRLGDDRDK